jgi:hypothetical protein
LPSKVYRRSLTHTAPHCVGPDTFGGMTLRSAATLQASRFHSRARPWRRERCLILNARGKGWDRVAASTCRGSGVSAIWCAYVRTSSTQEQRHAAAASSSRPQPSTSPSGTQIDLFGTRATTDSMMQLKGDLILHMRMRARTAGDNLQLCNIFHCQVRSHHQITGGPA